MSNGGSQGLLVIGGGKSAGDHVTSFWSSVAAGLDPDGVDGTAGEPVTFVNGAAAISSQSLAGFELVAVASSSFETSSGGLTTAENDALSGRENDVATFVNGGGGLVGLTQRGFAVPFDYLAGLGAFEINPLEYSNIDPTSDGAAVGVTDALDVCCWHEVFDSFPEWLTVLATEAESGSNRVAALGGRASALPGSLTAAETLGGNNRSHRYRPQADCGQPVNCATGNFWHTFVDLAVPGRGPGTGVERTYNSLDADSDGPFGRGWSSNVSMHLVEGPSGQVTVHQENGAVVVFAPDGTGGYTTLPRVKATLTGDAAGFTLVRQEREQVRFDADGRVTAIEDLNGDTVAYDYDANGDLVTMTDAAGRSLSFAHDTEGRVTSVTDPAGRVTSYSYDAAGDLVTVTDVAGGVTAFTYDAEHRLLTMTDPRGGTVSNTYDSDSRVVEQTDEVGGTLGFAYTATGTTITNARGFVIDQQYTDGMLTSLTKGVGTAEEATWTYVYDPFTLGATEVTDPNGHTTERVFDDAGNVVSVTDPLGRQTTFGYGPHNELTAATDASGVTTTFTHDTNANLLAVSRPLTGSGVDQVTTYAYDDPAHPGDVTAVTDPTGRQMQLAYDTDGNVVSVTDPAGETATYGYDGVGRRTSMVSPAGHTTTWTYDPFGAVTSVVDPTGASTTYGYDPNGNLVSVTDPDGNTTGFVYDPADRRTSVHRPDGTTVTTGYDAKGNVVSQTDAAGHSTTYSYDPLDRLRTSTDPLARTTELGYDPGGNLIERVDPDAGTATFSYDAADQVVAVAYSDGTTPAVAYTYDELGRRTTMTDGTGTTTHTWDSLGRLTDTVNGAGDSVGYDYDLAGRVTAVTYPNGNTVTRSHDQAGRFSALTDWLGNTTTFGYDLESNLTSTQMPNGTDAAYTFDPAGRVTGIGHTGPAGSLASFDHTRTASGLLSSTTSTGLAQPAETYTYTDLDQLASVNEVAYGYDPADNLTAMAAATHTYDDANQLTERSDPAGTTVFDYDARGNRIETTPPEGPAVGYTYDQANRLTGVSSGTTGAGTDLAGGQNHTVAALPDATVWTWGHNGSGQLGDGTTTSSTTPVEVPGLSVTAVGAGVSHSLGLRTDGTVAAWGANFYGQLSDGTTTGQTSPTSVTGLADVTDIAAGNYHSLAVTGDGSVWAWGYNGTGQLGDGTTTSSTTPVQVPGLDDVVAVAAGGISGWSGHSLALRSDGTVWAWGYNKAGQLGDGTKNHRASPVQVTGLTDVVAIAADGDNGYALRSDGTVWAWGDNSYDQLGNTGVNKMSSVPVLSVTLVGDGRAL